MLKGFDPAPDAPAEAGGDQAGDGDEAVQDGRGQTEGLFFLETGVKIEMLERRTCGSRGRRAGRKGN